jgi:hypothetical protein
VSSIISSPNKSCIETAMSISQVSSLLVLFTLFHHAKFLVLSCQQTTISYVNHFQGSFKLRLQLCCKHLYYVKMRTNAVAAATITVAIVMLSRRPHELLYCSQFKTCKYLYKLLNRLLF